MEAGVGSRGLCYLSRLRLQLALGPFGVDVLSVCCINYCVQCLPQVLGYLASSGPQADAHRGIGCETARMDVEVSAVDYAG